MSDRTITFGGEQFTIADRIGLMPLMRFAKVAKAGADSANMDGLVAMYDLLEQCLPADEWERFQVVADRERADGEALMGVVGEVFSALSERPTSRPSDSSDGPIVTEPRSASEPDSSERERSLRLVRDLEESGRADKAEFVALAMAASAS